jgi:CRP/FNR family transcriptional regulator, cyclic AMP receptor protein
LDPARLRSVPLFAALSDRDRRQVAQWADEIEVEPERALASQGQFGYEFFVIEEGRAEVLRDGVAIAELGPGDFFGELALLETDRRTATVVARTPMRLIVMHRREFRHMEREMPRVAEQVREAVKQRLPQPPGE